MQPDFVLAGIVGGVLCIIAAVILALKRSDGWGWFLFAALLMISSAGYYAQPREPSTIQVGP